MEMQPKNIFASKPFKFIVDGNPLYIHAELVASHSKPLDRLINGHMAEAERGFAVLEDVDEGTFIRFIQWAYNGYYSAADFNTTVSLVELSLDGDEVQSAVTSPHPLQADFSKCIIDEPPLQPEYEPPLEPEGDLAPPPPFVFWGGSPTAERKGKKSKKENNHFSKETLKEIFVSRPIKVRQEHIGIPPPRPNKDPQEDYTNVFLSHAQLHVFAEKYDIQTLKVLALENLQITLAIFTLYRSRTGDIVELLRYIYECKKTVPGTKDLRKLMTDYMGYEMDTLMKDEDFKNLMIEDGGTLLGDFMKMVQKRI